MLTHREGGRSIRALERQWQVTRSVVQVWKIQAPHNQMKYWSLDLEVDVEPKPLRTCDMPAC